MKKDALVIPELSKPAVEVPVIKRQLTLNQVLDNILVQKEDFISW